MELCYFSLDEIPGDFEKFLHQSSTVEKLKEATTSGGDDAAVTVKNVVGALVLNALVQDIIHGVSFLHEKGVRALLHV